ncbi:ankyrin-1-like [Phymastichus coffea]|uniref:ankyrin-1-like n=1 Tax=Phymastichus coffea TaxID=108790 RepID=UPI00273B5D14|nr:ankyrin-1-like [Phymastichus coffea]
MDYKLQMAQFQNNYTYAKEQTENILNNVASHYSIPDNRPNELEISEWTGYTKLHFGVKTTASHLIEHLISHDGNNLVVQGKKNGCTPLHIAARIAFNTVRYDGDLYSEEYKSYKDKKMQEYLMINTLLSKQVDFNIPFNPMDKHGVSHFHIACIVDHAIAVEFFIKAKEPLEQRIQYKSNHNYDDYVNIKQLQGYTPLHCAIAYSSVQAAHILIRYGANLRVKNAKNLSCFDLLIERLMRMTNVITMGKRRLSKKYVEQKEKIEHIIKIVLFTKTTNELFISDRKFSGLHLASTLKDKSTIEYYLSQNMDINMSIRDKFEFWQGWTPLHFASIFNVETMVFLMENGADITIKNVRGDTPLDLCAKRFRPVEIETVLSVRNELKDIVLSDDQTKLSDLLLAMNDYDSFTSFIYKLKDINLIIPWTSPIWAGYNMLHLSISLNEKKLFCEDVIQFELPQTESVDDDFYNCTEEEEALYWKRIELCLKCGCSVNKKNAKGQTPIHLAFCLFKRKAVTEMLKLSEDNIFDQNSLSSLHIACTSGDLDPIKRYIEGGADVNSRVKCSFYWPDIYQCEIEPMSFIRVNSTPLHIAVAFGHKKISEYLIMNKADVYARDTLDLTPVHLIMSRYSVWIQKNFAQSFFKMIPNLRNAVSQAGLTHLHVAVKADDQSAINRMKQEGANIDSVVDAKVTKPNFLARLAGKTPLLIAKDHSIKAIKSLLKHGANVHIKDLTGVSFLQYSIYDLDNAWTEPLVRVLKKGFYNVEDSGITLLHFACGTCDVVWVSWLLDNGADANARISIDGDLQGATPLYMIFTSSTTFDMPSSTIIDLVNMLLDHNADVTIDCGGCTPLHRLYQDMLECEDFYLNDKHEIEFMPDVVDLLLESQRSYNVNPTNSQGFSHFHFACARNNLKVINKFLDNGVDINLKVDPFVTYIGGFTPLHFAMADRRTEAAYLLLEKGADVRAQDAYGNEPLQVGIKSKFINLPLIARMLKLGADIHTTNLKGESVFDCLLDYGGLSIESLEFFLTHNCYLKVSDVEQGIIGSSMLSIAPKEFQPILERFMEIDAVKMAMQNGINIIDSIVAIKHDGEVTVDNYLKCIGYLIDKDCDINQQDTKGQTSLHKATNFSNVEAVKALLRLGADVNIVDNENESPFSQILSNVNYRACEFRKKAVIRTLECHIWKLKLIALELNDLNSTYIERREFEVHHDDIMCQNCQDELKKAQITVIVQFITVKDFLSEFEAIYRYPRLSSELRDVIDNFFKCPYKLRREFPEFHELLAKQYRKACIRQRLVQPTRDAITAICGVRFPDLCLELILDYFPNTDMKITIKNAKELFG